MNSIETLTSALPRVAYIRGPQPSAQRAAFAAHADTDGIPVANIYEDGEVSSALPRPGFARLQADLDAGVIGEVLVTRPDRLTRSVKEWARLSSQATITLMEPGAQLGPFFAQMMAAVDAYEQAVARRRA